MLSKEWEGVLRNYFVHGCENGMSWLAFDPCFSIDGQAVCLCFSSLFIYCIINIFCMGNVMCFTDEMPFPDWVFSEKQSLNHKHRWLHIDIILLFSVVWQRRRWSDCSRTCAVCSVVLVMYVNFISFSKTVFSHNFDFVICLVHAKNCIVWLVTCYVFIPVIFREIFPQKVLQKDHTPKSCLDDNMAYALYNFFTSPKSG